MIPQKILTCFCIFVGRFLYCNSSNFQDSCSVLSPMLSVTEKSCITFDYYTKFLAGYNASLSIYMMSYRFGNIVWTPAWSMRRDSGSWNHGQLEYTGNLTDASLIINMHLGQAGIDNIVIVPGDCQEISMCNFILTIFNRNKKM